MLEHVETCIQTSSTSTSRLLKICTQVLLEYNSSSTKYRTTSLLRTTYGIAYC